MAIKRRDSAVDQAKIEAFGAAADAPAQPAATEAAPTTAAPLARPTVKAPAGEWPTGIPKSLLIRWPDAALAVELADVAALEDRSQHKTAIRAMQRGLEVLRAEHRD